MALAAALACVAAGALLWHLIQPRRPAPAPPIAAQPRSVEPLADEDVTPSAPASQAEQPWRDNPAYEPRESVAVAAGREPNAYESLLFRAGQQRKSLARHQQTEQLVAEAIAHLVANPTADPSTAAAPLVPQRATSEPRLATIAQRSRGEEQLAAIGLLGIVGTRRCVPILLELSQRAAVHDAAVRSLAALADAALIGRLAAAEQNSPLRQHLLATLLKRGDAASVAVFLSFVEGDAKDPLASQVATEVSPVPLETLLGFLHAPQPSQRMAAARVLGQIDDPRIPARLIQMVLENVYRQEALLALLASPRREASDFLALARRDPLLVASVQAAHYRFANLP
jgi:hypothetical protein